MCLGVWLNAADALVTATLMPSVARNLGGYVYFAWATAGFLLGGIVAGATAGRLAERLGLRHALAGAAIVYAVGCGLSAAAPDIFVFLSGRLVQGFGGGWIVGLCFVAIADLFPETLQPRLFAAISAMWAVATLLGPLVGSVFAAAGLWRWAFWGFFGQAGLFAVAAVRLLPHRPGRPSEGSPPLTQLLVLVAAVSCTALADILPSPPAALGLVAIGLALLELALRIDRRARGRLFPRGAADVRATAGAAYAMIFLLSAGAIAFSVYGAALLQARYRLTPLWAGYGVGAEAIGWSLAAIIASRAPERLRSGMIRIGAAVVGCGMAGLAFSFGRAPLVVILAAAGAVGAGFGACFAFVNARVVASVGQEERGLASSAVPTVQMTGNAVGAATAGAMANLLGLSHGVTFASAGAVAPWLFGVFVPVCGLGWWASLRVAAVRKP